jgi:nucleoside-diphosphate-sugar epimerase
MKKTILVAGATGNLGHRIVKALLERDATVRALVRKDSKPEKVQELETEGVEISRVETYSVAELTEACIGVDVVVSALQGLQEVIVDAQKALLDAAIAAGVPRFIPSDFSVDFLDLPAGENRNFDLRREFHQYLEGKPIKTTSIFNGAFAEVLMYGNPLLNLQDKTVGYWEDADAQLDFTTMDDTAAFTAAAALDDDAPKVTHIASFRLTPTDLAVVAGEATDSQFAPVRMGSLENLRAYNQQERAAHPEGENELYPAWQQSQYMQSMFTAVLQPLDNNRYPGIAWTSAEALMKTSLQHA